MDIDKERLCIFCFCFLKPENKDQPSGECFHSVPAPDWRRAGRRLQLLSGELETPRLMLCHRQEQRRRVRRCHFGSRQPCLCHSGSSSADSWTPASDEGTSESVWLWNTSSHRNRLSVSDSDEPASLSLDRSGENQLVCSDIVLHLMHCFIFHLCIPNYLVLTKIKKLRLRSVGLKLSNTALISRNVMIHNFTEIEYSLSLSSQFQI